MACRGCKQHEAKCSCGMNGKKHEHSKEHHEVKQTHSQEREQFGKQAQQQKKENE
ncbi:hypothetical protein M1446_01240 [Candidatus Dependentiae bacterium]|nr:hypothetical protein [Candidatus Dependentiae bacterium]